MALVDYVNDGKVGKFTIKDHRISSMTELSGLKIYFIRKKITGSIFGATLLHLNFDLFEKFRISQGVLKGCDYFMQNLVIICCSNF